MYTLYTDETNTIGLLKAKLQDLDVLTIDKQIFIHGGQRLADNNTLSDYDIRNEDTIHLVEKKSYKLDISVFNETKDREWVITWDFENKTDDSVLFFKSAVLRKCRDELNLRRFDLYCDNKKMEGSISLSKYDVSNGVIIIPK